MSTTALRTWQFLLTLTIAIAAPPGITVRVYNPAGVPDSELKRATSEASRILSKAAVTVYWADCNTGLERAQDDSCRDSDDPLSFGVTIATAAPKSAAPYALGWSLPSANGNYAAVHYPRILDMTKKHPAVVTRDKLLAGVIVHEITHLILSSPAHSPGGIMRGLWTLSEGIALSQGRLRFTHAEIVGIHQALSRRRDAAARPIARDASSVAMR